MASTDRESEKRQREREPSDISELLRGGIWEILNLCQELAELRAHSSACYSLFPRFRAALILHMRARAAILPRLRELPEVAGWERENAEWEKLLDAGDFPALRRRLEVALAHARDSVIPELVAMFTADERAEMGECYKERIAA